LFGDCGEIGEGALGDAFLQVRGARVGLEAHTAVEARDSDDDFKDLGMGACRLTNKTSGRPISTREGIPEKMELRLATASSCKKFCKGKETPDSSGKKCWGYMFLAYARKCILYMNGPLTLQPPPRGYFTEDHCNIALKFHSVVAPGHCVWTQQDGYYVYQGHGSGKECYGTFDEAKKKCEAAADCKAIERMSSTDASVSGRPICDGKYRVSHGGPTLMYGNAIGVKTTSWYCKWTIDTRTEEHKAAATYSKWLGAYFHGFWWEWG
jgi:hypothetical protein